MSVFKTAALILGQLNFSVHCTYFYGCHFMALMFILCHVFMVCGQKTEVIAQIQYKEHLCYSANLQQPNILLSRGKEIPKYI